MLRRVVRGLQIGLLVLGTIIFLWLPISYYYIAAVETSQWPSGVSVYSTEGVATAVVSLDSSAQSLDFNAGVQGISWEHGANSLWPSFGYDPEYTVDTGDAVPSFLTVPANVHVSSPLWLLAVVCLAWPVTSLLVRRRRGRGFAVEAKAARPVTTS